jgi:hypothetical protein
VSSLEGLAPSFGDRSGILSPEGELGWPENASAGGGQPKGMVWFSVYPKALKKTL